MFEPFYRNYLSEFRQTLRALDVRDVEKIMRQLESARQEGRQVFIVGNGGSAASSAHWACDFGKGLNVGESKRLRVCSLTDNVALSTAISNDIAYDEVFVEQLKNRLNPKDVVIGLSVSGDSENVVRALAYAREQEALAISIVGKAEGRMVRLTDISLVIPSRNYGIVEDTHMFIAHVVSQYMKGLSAEAVG
ncbi:MAG: SIS domain-containing protein [Firmicutes bacterium]|nr:SIS domain-containing protein [Bacillota bacterium]